MGGVRAPRLQDSPSSPRQAKGIEESDGFGARFATCRPDVHHLVKAVAHDKEANAGDRGICWNLGIFRWNIGNNLKAFDVAKLPRRRRPKGSVHILHGAVAGICLAVAGDAIPFLGDYFLFAGDCFQLSAFHGDDLSRVSHAGEFR